MTQAQAAYTNLLQFLQSPLGSSVAAVNTDV